MATESSNHNEEMPDPRLLWKWLGRAGRPWLGWVLIGVGALLVLLGYLGVSRESIVAKQVPFIVSGGIGGIVLAVLGAYVLGTEELRRDSGRLDRLEVMVSELHAVLLTRADAPELPEVLTGPAANGSHHGDDTSELARPSEVVVLPGGEMFHRAECELVAGKDGAEQVKLPMARRRALKPCPLCEPAPAGTPS